VYGPLSKQVINECWGGILEAEGFFYMSTVQTYGHYTPDWDKVEWETDEEWYGCEQDDAIVMVDTFIAISNDALPDGIHVTYDRCWHQTEDVEPPDAKELGDCRKTDRPRLRLRAQDWYVFPR
jgi:hypothetical protein